MQKTFGKPLNDEVFIMNENKYKEAKEIFMKYDGNHFFMAREEIYDTYKKYEVPEALEKNGCKS